MKILYTASIRLPTEKAHGIQIMKTCEALAESGANVTLLVPRFGFSPDEKKVFDYYNVKQLFSIKRAFSIRLIRFGAVGFFLETLVFFICMLFTKEFWSSDYIFSRDEILVSLSSIFRKKLIWETHVGSYNLFARIALKHTQKVIAISQGLKDFYLSKGAQAERILIAHDGVDLESFSVLCSKSEARKILGLPEDKKVVMYVGRVDGWKGATTFFEASKSFNEETVAAVIGGEEAQINKLKRQYTRVTFLGSKPYKDLPVYQKSADVLVIPNSGSDTISRLYTSPLKLFAHMASGVPIVASDLPSLREVLTEGNAVLVKPDDSTSLYMGIQTILEKRINADILARQALQDVEQYSWKLRAQRIINFLNL
jgi:glycosyltransferase involved in cell wall biosynthesis